MEPIRILHENVIMETGGIETQLMRIYRKIDRSKIQFDFLVHRKEKGAYDDEIRALGGKIYYSEPFNPFKHKDYVKSMDDFFKSHPEYKIMISHSELALWPLIVAKRNNVPIRICYSHNGRSKFCLKRVFMDFERLFIKKYCNKMFAVSKLAGNYTFGKKSVNNGTVKIIKNGLIVDDFKFDSVIRSKKRKELNLDNSLVFIHIGRFMVQKNHNFLIDIFKEIQKKYDNSVLLLIGEGRLENKIRVQVKKYGLEDKIRFLGRRKDINELLMASDMMILPSFYEGFPNVAIESQAASLPILMSTNITNEACLTEYCKQMSLSKNAVDWANAVDDILNCCFERKDMSNIMNDIGHNIEKIVEWYEEFYLSVINE